MIIVNITIGTMTIAMCGNAKLIHDIAVRSILQMKRWKMADICIGWLSPEGKLYECEYMEHLSVARELCIELGQTDIEYPFHPDDWLLDHGWVHLTMITLMEYGWAVIFPTSGHLTAEQHNFLKPYVEQNKDFLAESFVTDLKYEFQDLFDWE